MRLLIIVAGLIWCLPATAAEPSKDRAQVSNFSLMTAQGEQFKFEQAKGKVVVLSFWASWCKPCIQELGFLQKLSKKLDGQFTVLAISTDDSNTIAAVRKIVRQKKLKMPVLLDQQGSVMSEYNPRGDLPYSVYVDKQGRIASTHQGFVSGDESKIEALIKTLIAEPNTTKK
ncbi:MAG: TlpA disulfide reductase family protein [Myxococcota bacterium]|nr:TlpA disulfide reductase family protein [Myxococcota bacterium]